MPRMVVSNAQRETAIVIRRNGEIVVYVRLKPGRLACERTTEALFRAAWCEECCYSLQETLGRLLAHADACGATQEALRGLERLRDRERNAVASLF